MGASGSNMDADRAAVIMAWSCGSAPFGVPAAAAHGLGERGRDCGVARGGGGVIAAQQPTERRR